MYVLVLSFLFLLFSLTSLYNHLSWFVFLLCTLFFRFFLSLWLSFLGESLMLSVHLFDSYPIDLSVRFFFDFVSSWFFSVVLLISTVIRVYSFFYISPYSKSNYFLWLTIIFVVSMLLVISMSNLFFLMLGWDGLGLISFFLIVYYQNQSSLVSGFFTVIINRLGDGFFLVSIVLLIYRIENLTVFPSSLLSSLRVFLLILTFITKRALFPFSPWLPAAMAAPTPISALVHSSTLVTSGLFLIMRFSYILYSINRVITLLLLASVFTSFYAGLNTIFEKDLKKLIALSTLSHLGFIGIAFSSGLLYLSFFHMLTHALFKSLLFITIGDIIINQNHSQDIRYLSKGSCLTPFSSYVILVSILNLLGLPTVRGYFSKDLVLESLNYSFISHLFQFFVFLNVFFTYYYSYQLFYFSFHSSKLVPFQIFNSPILLHSWLILFLRVLSVSFGVFFMSHLVPSLLFLIVPTSLKFVPLFLNLIYFFSLLVILKLFTSFKVFPNSFFSSIIFLSPFISRVTSSVFLGFSSQLFKVFETGALSSFINKASSAFVFSSSKAILAQSFYNPLKIILFSTFLILLFSI